MIRAIVAWDAVKGLKTHLKNFIPRPTSTEKRLQLSERHHRHVCHQTRITEEMLAPEFRDKIRNKHGEEESDLYASAVVPFITPKC